MYAAAIILAVHLTRDHVLSAYPNAPVVPDRPHRVRAFFRRHRRNQAASL
jgi:hypothetical protein